MKEFILCAANHYNNLTYYNSGPVNVEQGFVICGRRHHDCIRIFAMMVGFPYSPESQKLQNTEVQGFLTSKNRFVDRLEALQIAKEADQLITGAGNPKLGLFSEDLY